MNHKIRSYVVLSSQHVFDERLKYIASFVLRTSIYECTFLQTLITKEWMSRVLKSRQELQLLFFWAWNNEFPIAMPAFCWDNFSSNWKYLVVKHKETNKLRDLNLRANYTDQVTAAFRQVSANFCG
jgi:hypothetical protein